MPILAWLRRLAGSICHVHIDAWPIQQSFYHSLIPLLSYYR
ncbi:Protein of unknown function [Pyronema omphalodes CBS 100304]|uniref:Uncharacterized protein n=1 Tax=Pyronema omphalodes (strain CBS 100304) TaxID=1076935 RepID=U4KUR9_PYROM|nr:Protein of unknown function [Pyronema omphalodes CBS 100304]